MFRKLRGFPHPDLGLWNFGRPNYAIYQTVRSEPSGPVYEIPSERSHVSAVVRALTDNLLRVWAPTYSAAGRAQALATYLGDKVAEARQPPVVGVGVNQLSQGWLPASVLGEGYGQGWKHRLYGLFGEEVRWEGEHAAMEHEIAGALKSGEIFRLGMGETAEKVYPRESESMRTVSYRPARMVRANPWKMAKAEEAGVDALAVLTTVKSELLDLEKLRSRVGLSAGTPIVVIETGEARFCGRPALGGDSLGREIGDTGTLGCLVANTAGERFILSCAHVIAATDKGRRNQDVILQPGPLDGGGAKDRIGVLYDYKEIDLSTEKGNAFDAALCRPDSPEDVQPGIRGLSKAGFDGYYDDPPLEIPVMKAGRQTKVTHGVLRLTGLDHLVTLPSGAKALFEDQLAIIGSGRRRFAEQGDSGAVIVDENSNKAVGLLYATAEGTDLAYASPIKKVLDHFGVRLV